MGDDLTFLGFRLPIEVHGPSNVANGGPRFAVPRPGMCMLCKQYASHTYVAGLMESVCDHDLAAVTKKGRMLKFPFRLPPARKEVPKFDKDWWDRRFRR